MPAPPNLTTQILQENPQRRRFPTDGRGSAIQPSTPSLLGSIHNNLAVVYIAGASVTTRLRMGSVHIEQQQGQPDRCSFRMDGTAPLAGQEIKIGLGDLTLANLLFAGSIVSVEQVYEGTPANQGWTCECMDYTWLLNRRRPYGTFTGSATTIAQALIATFAPSFTAQHVQAALATVTIVFDGSNDFQGCLRQLATLIGGYWYIDYAKDLHVFTAESTGLPANLDGTGTTLQLTPPVTLQTDLQQLRTRTNVQGAGSRILAPLAIGETIIPVENPLLFPSTGGSVINNGQVITYTSRSQAAPAVAPALAAASGSGLNLGVYNYAYTDVTASGESLPSPIAAITLSAVTTPATSPTFVSEQFGNGPDGADVIEWACTFVSAVGETIPGPRSTAFDAPYGPGDTRTINLSTFPIGPSGTTARKLYRSLTSGGTLFFVKTIADNVTTSGQDDVGDASLGAAAPSSNPTAQQVSVSSVAVGPAGTTSRKIYRTVVGGSTLKLVTTLADNTTTTYTDSTADGSLGATAPATDTSGLVLFGLTTTSGATASGATTINVTSAASFSSTGGWALIGTSGLAIRYTGTGGTTLTGVPASGNGSVSTAIPSGTLIQGIAGLTGVPATGTGSVTVALNLGDVVDIFVQRNDTSAQATMAGVDGGDGVYEFHLHDDTLITVAQCQARGDADLARFSTSIQTLRYTTRDLLTRVGKPITAVLPSPTSISGTFTIQRVTIDQIDVAAGRMAPRYTVEASRVLLTIDAWLQQFQTKAA